MAVSAAVGEWTQKDNFVWLVAQSNVAVKNIAESLCKHGVDFRIVVSKDFYFGW